MTDYRKEYDEFAETFMANMYSFEVGAFCYDELNPALQKILYKNLYDEEMDDDYFLFMDFEKEDEYDEGNPDDGYVYFEYKKGMRLG
jgi:hypothetical protein